MRVNFIRARLSIISVYISWEKLHNVDSVFDVQRAYLVIGQLMEDQILKTVCLLANEYTHLIYDLNDNNPDIYVGTLCDVRTVQRPFWGRT